jgi:hypothetical protein
MVGAIPDDFQTIGHGDQPVKPHNVSVATKTECKVM